VKIAAILLDRAVDSANHYNSMLHAAGTNGLKGQVAHNLISRVVRRSESMEYRQLGKTGIKVSMPGLGCIFHGASENETGRFLKRALDMGINYFDTSPGYEKGMSEDRIGKAIGSRHDDFYIATKVDALDRDGARLELENSLQRLRMDHVDVLQLHNMHTEELLCSALKSGGAIETLLRAKEEGKTRFIGLTGHRPDVLCKGLSTGLFDVVLFVLNLAQTYALSDLVTMARSQGVGSVVMKPLARGWMTGRLRQTLQFTAGCNIDTMVFGVSSEKELEQNMAALSGEKEPSDTQEFQRAVSNPAVACRLGCIDCKPCPAGIRISASLQAKGIDERYGVPSWKKEEYTSLKEAAAACEAEDSCRNSALCEIRCPYGLSIRSEIQDMAKVGDG
jgi:uncharacterized protein